MDLSGTWTSSHQVGSALVFVWMAGTGMTDCIVVVMIVYYLCRIYWDRERERERAVKIVQYKNIVFPNSLSGEIFPLDIKWEIKRATESADTDVRWQWCQPSRSLNTNQAQPHLSPTSPLVKQLNYRIWNPALEVALKSVVKNYFHDQ